MLQDVVTRVFLSSNLSSIQCCVTCMHITLHYQQQTCVPASKFEDSAYQDSVYCALLPPVAAVSCKVSVTKFVQNHVELSCFLLLVYQKYAKLWSCLLLLVYTNMLLEHTTVFLFSRDR